MVEKEARMQSVRIEAVATLGGEGIRPLYEVDVVCDCGQNCLVDKSTGEPSFRHRIAPGQGQDKILICRCGKKYRLHPQRTHIHVSSV